MLSLGNAVSRIWLAIDKRLNSKVVEFLVPSGLLARPGVGSGCLRISHGNWPASRSNRHPTWGRFPSGLGQFLLLVELVVQGRKILITEKCSKENLILSNFLISLFPPT